MLYVVIYLGLTIFVQYQIGINSNMATMTLAIYTTRFGYTIWEHNLGTFAHKSSQILAYLAAWP